MQCLTLLLCLLLTGCVTITQKTIAQEKSRQKLLNEQLQESRSISKENVLQKPSNEPIQKFKSIAEENLLQKSSNEQSQKFKDIAAENELQKPLNEPIQKFKKIAVVNEPQKPLDEPILQPKTLKPNIERAKQPDHNLNFIIAEFDALLAQKSKPSNKQLNNTDKFATQLVQQKKQVINNPSDNGLEFGLHTASYHQQENVESGWHVYQKRYQTLFKEKKAMIQSIDISGTQYWRLIVAPYDSAEHAKSACKQLQKNNDFCQVVSYKR